MARKHGKRTIVRLGASDISTYTKSSEFSRKADTEDTTTYGSDSKRYDGSLLDATFKMEGVYEDGASGPRAIINPLIGTTTTLTRQPEGTGAGLPQDVVDLVITGYVETSPASGYVMWSAEGQCSGDVDSTPQ